MSTTDKEKSSCPTSIKMNEEKDQAGKPSAVDYAQQLRDEVFSKIGKVPSARQQNDKDDAKRKFILGRSKSGHQIQISTTTQYLKTDKVSDLESSRAAQESKNSKPMPP